jgi:hypothetical protein
VCIDYFANWVEACPLKSQDAVSVVDAILSLIITRHRCPEKILTNKGTQFTEKDETLLADGFLFNVSLGCLFNAIPPLSPYHSSYGDMNTL